MGTSSVEMPPFALIARLAALVTPPKRHTVRYFGMLSSYVAAESVPDKPKRNFRYIRPGWTNRLCREVTTTRRRLPYQASAPWTWQP